MAPFNFEMNKTFDQLHYMYEFKPKNQVRYFNFVTIQNETLKTIDYIKHLIFSFNNIIYY